MARKPAGVGWEREISKVLHAKDGITLRTLHDARQFALNLEPRHQASAAWQHAAKLMLEAAAGGDIVAATRQIELALVLTMRVDYSRSN